MKNTLLTLISFLNLGLSAQPVFNLENLIGDSHELTYKKATIEGGLGPMTGSQQWNFSGLESDSGITVTLRDLSQLPPLNAPAGANKLLVKLFESGASPEDQFNFFKADASGLEQLTIRADGLKFSAFSTPIRELNFPVVYDPDQVLYSTSVTFTEPAPFTEGDSIRTHRSIQLIYSVPSYGTVNTPAYSNIEVLVIQRLETVTDSIEYFTEGNWTSLPSETYFNEYYDFLASSLGYYVLRAKLIDDFKNTGYEIYHLVGTQIVNTQNVKSNNLNFYPNPASDFIQIQSDAPFDCIELYDLQGRIIKTQISNQDNVIQISDVNSGFYVLKCTRNGTSFSKKIIIQH